MLIFRNICEGNIERIFQPTLSSAKVSWPASAAAKGEELALLAYQSKQ